MVAQLCDRVAVMYAGRIVEGGADRGCARPAPPSLYQPADRLRAGTGRRQAGGWRRSPGLPPMVDDLPPGCAFAPRCHKARAGVHGGRGRSGGDRGPGGALSLSEDRAKREVCGMIALRALGLSKTFTPPKPLFRANPSGRARGSPP